MHSILVSYEAPFRSNLQWSNELLRMTLRLVAFNFFERELININIHLCYALRRPFKGLDNEIYGDMEMAKGGGRGMRIQDVLQFLR